ncbi:MAG: RES domain-containing protein [Candidatus Cybelea sp.]
MRFFRVLPYDANAAPNERGGVLYIPGNTAGRIANPDLYRELYLSAEPEGAIAESLGRLPIWYPSDFVRANGVTLALATYELPDAAPIFDLDSVKALASLGIERPSDIVTRNRKVSQSWARLIFERGEHVGVRWWNYYNPDWTSLGLWDASELRAIEIPESLSLQHPLVQATALAIVRQIQT